MSKAERSNTDRYLSLRDGVFQYHRKVPKSLRALDDRYPKVRISLFTKDRGEARIKRDAIERADDDLWASLLLGNTGEGAISRHRAAVARAEAMGFSYRTAGQLIGNGVDIGDLMTRLNALHRSPPASAASDALLGQVDEPVVTVKEAFKTFLKEVAPPQLLGKSEFQRKSWEKVKRRAVDNFIRVIGDVTFSSISRDQARRFYQMWMARIAPPSGRPTHTASSGNRDLGNMRKLYREYHDYIGDHDRPNPFDGLAFSEKLKRKRPPFKLEWVRDQFLGTDKLLRLNPEARGIILMMIETGARPSELANLSAKTIHLNEPVPYIEIAPRTDPDDPREIKTSTSVRSVPLVGVALAVAKAFPGGFPRYWNNESTLSNTLNKSLDECGLLPKPAPSPRHTAYSMRHTFEDRMKEGRVDAELRKALMGHSIDRPEYGEGGSLRLKQQALETIAFPYREELVSAEQMRKS